MRRGNRALTEVELLERRSSRGTQQRDLLEQRIGHPCQLGRCCCSLQRCGIVPGAAKATLIGSYHPIGGLVLHVLMFPRELDPLAGGARETRGPRRGGVGGARAG